MVLYVLAMLGDIQGDSEKLEIIEKGSGKVPRYLAGRNSRDSVPLHARPSLHQQT